MLWLLVVTRSLSPSCMTRKTTSISRPKDFVQLSIYFFAQFLLRHARRAKAHSLTCACLSSSVGMNNAEYSLTCVVTSGSMPRLSRISTMSILFFLAPMCRGVNPFCTTMKQQLVCQLHQCIGSITSHCSRELGRSSVLYPLKQRHLLSSVCLLHGGACNNNFFQGIKR